MMASDGFLGFGFWKWYRSDEKKKEKKNFGNIQVWTTIM